jgi:hypothetical protein
MKLLNTLFTAMLAILMTAGSASGQYVTVGTATGTNATTAQSPINIWYRSMHYQTIYTATELLGAGFLTGASIQEIGWDVTGAPASALPNYTISMGLTANTTSGVANYVASSALVQVYNNPLYSPTAGGFDMVQLFAPFAWDGASSLVVDVCFDMVLNFDQSGQVSTFPATDGSTSTRSDGANQCGVPANVSHTYKPVAQFFIVNGLPPTSACPAIMAPDTTGFEDGGILNACWEQDSLDVLDWTILTGPTGSVGTGPNGASNGSFYAYLESSNPVASGDSAILISPPYNTSMLADAPALYFNYHMFGNDSMVLRVEYQVFGSSFWTPIWEQVGAVQEADTDPYADAYIPLPNAANLTIRFRFIAVAQTNNGAVPGAGNAGASDIAIDDIRIQNVLANDVAVTDIITPGNDCGLGVQPVTIEVTNRGFNAQSNVPVFVSVNGGTPVGALVTGPIPSNGGIGTVNVLVDMTMLGDYIIDAYTALSGDEITTNDVMEGGAYNQPAVVGEYNEEFEGSNGYWYATGDWEHGVPNDTIIAGAGAGSEAYVTNLAGTYTDGNVSYLYTPCFDIAAMASPRMRFSIYWDIEDDYDGAWLDYSTDGGATWSKLGTNNFSGQSWYTDSISNSSLGWVWNGTGADGSGGWVDAIIDLQSFGFTGEVRFRFVMFSDVATSNAGLGIDNFGIFDGCIETVLNETVVGASADGLSDGSITLNPVAGFGGYTYNWSTGSTMSSITGLAPGTYDVTVTDQATCSNTASFTIVSLCPTSLGLSVTINPEIGDDENNGSAEIMVTGGTAPYTYSWSNGTTTSSAFNLGGDSLTVTVTDANGCTDMVDVTIETVYMVGTENLEGLTSLVLSPNPSKNYTQLNINFNESVDLTVRLIDVTGRVLETRNAGNTMTEEMRFDVSNFAQGVYFMQIIANGQTATQRFVVIK